jgi:hypothetical protein
MRIAWATPFNERSAIGHSSYAAVKELRACGLEVEIVRTEKGIPAIAPPIAASFPVHSPGRFSFDLLRMFDATVVALGNNFLFHGEALPIIEAIPSIVVFHDADLRHLVTASVEAGLLSPATVAARRSNHGLPAHNGDTMGADLPWLAAMSIGAVAHSQHYAGLIGGHPHVPSLVLPLAKLDPGLPKYASKSRGQFVVTTFGVITPFKQVDRVLRALSLRPALLRGVSYRLIGPISESERARLLRLSDELRLQCLEIFDWVPDERLQELLGESDAICCLRRPIFEGASSALVMALYSARPTIVADAGSFAEVPSDLVWKVSYGDEPEDVASALQAIAADPAAARSRALKGRAWATKRHSPKDYANGLLPFIERCVDLAASRRGST